MRHTDIDQLKPQPGQSPKVNSYEVVNYLTKEGWNVTRADTYNTKSDNRPYGRHYVQLERSGWQLWLSNSYDGSGGFKAQLALDGIVLREVAIETLNNTIAESQDDVFPVCAQDLTVEQICSFRETVARRHYSLPAADVTFNFEFDPTNLWDAMVQMFNRLLLGAKINGKKSKTVDNPRTIIEIGQLIWTIAQEYVTDPVTETPTESVVIPERPNKFLYIGEGRTKRPNPEYAKWMELYSDLVEA